MTVRYLLTNQCYTVLIDNRPISIAGRTLFPTLEDLRETLKYCGLKLNGNKVVVDSTKPIHITEVTADPFSDEFPHEYENKVKEILYYLNNYKAAKFQTFCNSTSLLYHPSTKEAGRYQLTVCVNEKPISHSQHETLESVAERIAEYSNLSMVDYAS